MSIVTVQQLLSRISNGFSKNSTLYIDVATNRTGLVNAQTWNPFVNRAAYIESVPNPLETGVTAYIPIELTVHNNNSGNMLPAVLCEVINMGTLDIGTNTFTDGNAAPTRTYLGSSRQLPMTLWIECTTALNATPGNITFTYVDQNNNTAETTSSYALTASATVGSGHFGTLNTGDWGVLDITTASRTGGTTPTGVIKFWGIIPITALHTGAQTGLTMVEIAPENGFFSRLNAGAELALIHFGVGTNQYASYGNIVYVGDN